jgi:hypothetical protein
VLHGLRIYWFVLRASMLPKQVKVKNRACWVGHFQYGAGKGAQASVALKLIFGNSDSGVDYTHQNHQSNPGASTAQRRDSKMQGLLRLIL